MTERLLEVDHISKQYRLGMINGGSLSRDLESWWARKRGKEDPNTKVGAQNGLYTGKNDTFLALDDVSFNVDRGDAVALIGLNGAGKSTMLKVISRITSPTLGEIRARGRVASLLEIGTGFHRDLSGRDNIYLNGAILGMSRAEVNKKLNDIIEFSEISQFIDTPVKRYSSGMYVKLGFAVAAHLDPDLLICDEVLAVGDQAFQQKCLGKMREVATSGCAVMYVSHNMHTVAQLCNRGLFLDHGRLTYDGTTEHAIEHYSGSRNVATHIDCSTIRRNHARHGSCVRLETVDFLNTTTLEYQPDGTVEMRVHFSVMIRDPRVRFRVIVYSSLRAPVAVSHSETFGVEPGQDRTFTIKLSLDGLAPAMYSLQLSVTTPKPDGSEMNYDVCDDIGTIIVHDDPRLNLGLMWSERNWGNFRMTALEVSE